MATGIKRPYPISETQAISIEEMGESHGTRRTFRVTLVRGELPVNDYDILRRIPVAARETHYRSLQLLKTTDPGVWTAEMDLE